MSNEADGNESQKRAIAEQLFSVWTEEQRLTTKRNLWTGALPAWIACIMSALALVYSAGVVSQKVSEHSRQIDQLQTDSREQARDTRQAAVTMARIEAKIDLLLPALAERK